MAKVARNPEGQPRKPKAETLQETAIDWALKHPEAVAHAHATLGLLLEGLRHDDCFMDSPAAVGRQLEGQLSNLDLVHFREKFIAALVTLHQFSRAVHTLCPHLSQAARRATEEGQMADTAVEIESAAPNGGAAVAATQKTDERPAPSRLPSPFTAADFTGFLRENAPPITLEALKNTIDEFMEPFKIKRFISVSKGETLQPSSETLIRVYQFDGQTYAVHCCYKKQPATIIIYRRATAAQPWAIEAQWK